MVDELTRRAVCLLGIVCWSISAVAEDPKPEPAVPEIAAASNEGEIALRGFQLADGLKGALFAAEPLMANPVSFCLDEQGRVFVCESYRQNAGVTDNRGHDQKWLDDDLAAQTVADRLAYHRKHLGKKFAEYMLNDDRIRLLTDRDGDGRADDSTIFADHFNGAEEGTGAGVLAHRGKVFFTCIPNLWLLQDTTNDGRADSRTALHSGYGVRVAFRGHDLHGLCLGPDRRIYFSVGDRGYNVVTDGGHFANPESGAIFRCNLDGSGLEVVATGMRNPQELAFDDFGNLFTGDNNSDSGDKARWVYVVPGGDTGWRMAYQYLPDRGPFNREKIWHPFHSDQPAYIVPPIANFADGPSGLAYYPGVGLPDSFRGRFLLCDFRGGPANSGVRTFRVRPQGAFFELVDAEQPIWKILATDVDFGPDGSIYVSDWVNGWNGEGKGRIYRFYSPALQQDPLVLSTQQLLTKGLAEHTPSQLKELLGHPDRRVRMNAQFELVDRADWKTLEAAAAPGSTLLMRLHGLWGLGQRGAIHSEVFLRLLADPEAEVRAQVANLLGEAKYAAAIKPLVGRLQDDSARVRYFAAIALGRLGADEAVVSLAEMLANNVDRDPIVRHGGIMGLAGVRDDGALQPLLKHSSASVRLATVVALRKRKSALVSEFLHDREPRIVTEVARAIHDLPLESEFAKVAACWDRTTDDDALLRRVLNANFRLGGAENAQRLAKFAANPQSPRTLRLEAIDMLANWESPSSRDRVLGMWRPLANRDKGIAKAALQESLPGILAAPTTIRLAAAKLAARLEIAEAAEPLRALFAANDESGRVRSEALSSLAQLRPDDVPALLPAALADKSAEVRTAARGLLLKTDFPRAIVELERAVSAPSMMERQASVMQLAELAAPEAGQAVNRLMDELLQGKIPADTQLDLLSAAGKRSEQEIKSKLARFEETRAAADVPTKFQESLHGGNAERGREVFFDRTEASCVRCHKIENRGGEVGPDLSRIATDKTRQYLLEAIVDPNRAIAKGFESVTIVDTNGRIHVGVVKSENEQHIQIITAEAKTVTIDKKEIDERQPAKSPMPEDVAQKLSKFDIRDLVEFLSQLK